MKKRFSEEQIIGFLREAEADTTRCAIDQNLLAAPDLTLILKTLKGH